VVHLPGFIGIRPVMQQCFPRLVQFMQQGAFVRITDQALYPADGYQSFTSSDFGDAVDAG